jgi:hypothetical protein
MPAEVRGSNADPEYRRERARKAAYASHSTDARIDALIKSAPKLTAEQAERLRQLLPAPADADAQAGG